MPLKQVVVDAVRKLDDESDPRGVSFNMLRKFLVQDHTIVSITLAVTGAVKQGLLKQDGEYLKVTSIASSQSTASSILSKEQTRLERATQGAIARPQLMPSSKNQASSSPTEASVEAGINIFLFHRDLRLEDNTALLNCPKPVVPVFIFTPEQVDKTKNKYCSNESVQFMCASLEELDQSLNTLGSQLHMFYGETVSMLRQIHAITPIASVSQNRDYNKFAKERDADIAAWCASESIRFFDQEDYDLVKASELNLPDGRPYQVLAAYYSRFIKERPTAPVSTKHLSPHDLSMLDSAFPGLVPVNDLERFYVPNPKIAQLGGRSHATAALSNLPTLKNYEHDRNFPAIKGTTQLSAHLRFGTISIRELFWGLVSVFGTPNNALVRELVFRSFYIKICTHRPGLQRDEAFRKDVDKLIPWVRGDDPNYLPLWNAWVNGTSGYPLADAGMRQLNATGHMHGRVRMVAATILTRYMLIDWREGARYFAQHLVDYDPCSNNMGWQFSASLGENAQNIYRAPMNPFLQSKNFDPECEYIKRWIPELAKVSAKDIHSGAWNPKTTGYPAPIVSQKSASQRSIVIWKAAANKAAAANAPAPKKLETLHEEDEESEMSV